MPWNKITIEDKVTILIVTTIGILLVCIAILISSGLFRLGLRQSLKCLFPWNVDSPFSGPSVEIPRVFCV